MDDGALTEHQKGPRPVFYKINSRFRRFGCGTGLRARLNGYYISLTVPYTLGGSGEGGAFRLLWQVGSPREWVLIPAYSERPWKSPEKGAHPLLPRSEESA